MTGTKRVYEERGEEEGNGGRRERKRERERERRETRRGVAGCCRACADKGNLQLQSLARSFVRSLRFSSAPPALATHTTRYARRRRARTHGLVACNSARTHACTSRCCRNRTGYSRPRKRKVFELHTSLPPLPLCPRFVRSTLRLHPVRSLAFASSTLLLVERTREREIRRLRS